MVPSSPVAPVNICWRVLDPSAVKNFTAPSATAPLDYFVRAFVGIGKNLDLVDVYVGAEWTWVVIKPNVSTL